MSGPCVPLVVVEDTGVDVVVTPAVGVDPDTLGDNRGLALVAGDVTCCGEAVLVVNVLYNNQWLYDGSIIYSAQVA